MLKTKRGKVKGRGSVREILADYSCATRCILNLFTEEVGRELAMDMVHEAYRAGTLTDEELNNEIKDNLWKSLEKAQEFLKKDEEEVEHE